VVVASKQAIDKDRLLTNQMTFAPGVGIVRLQTVLHQTGKPPLPQVTMELARYQVGPTAPTPAPGAAPAP